ncbi:MAG: hypothetical protein IKF14_02450 [Atopobiaceae bacterium]|nr:hypothetical protein [Atopobiaceae bacterium]
MKVSRGEGGAAVEGRLTSPVARVPSCIEACGGVSIKGRVIKSLAYTTDVAVVRNCNGDAIFAVYPFTGEPVITQALMTVAQQPMFVGVGGGTTAGGRVVELAMTAEMQGVAGVVLNGPSTPETMESVMSVVDIPVIATVLDDTYEVDLKVLAGAAILNVAAGRRTAEVVAAIRERHPEMPIIASGGKTEESILATIEAGADAVVWTPPTAQELQWEMMGRYREM